MREKKTGKHSGEEDKEKHSCKCRRYSPFQKNIDKKRGIQYHNSVALKATQLRFHLNLPAWRNR